MVTEEQVKQWGNELFEEGRMKMAARTGFYGTWDRQFESREEEKAFAKRKVAEARAKYPELIPRGHRRNRGLTLVE